MKRLTNHDMIEVCLLINLYQSPESITRKVNLRFNKHYKVSNVERRLREMFNKEIVESKIYPNEHSSGTHKRWKLNDKEYSKRTPYEVLAEKAREFKSRLKGAYSALKGE